MDTIQGHLSDNVVLKSSIEEERRGKQLPPRPAKQLYGNFPPRLHFRTCKVLYDPITTRSMVNPNAPSSFLWRKTRMRFNIIRKKMRRRYFFFNNAIVIAFPCSLFPAVCRSRAVLYHHGCTIQHQDAFSEYPKT
jgi:hypothetical protein